MNHHGFKKRTDAAYSLVELTTAIAIGGIAILAMAQFMGLFGTLTFQRSAVAGVSSINETILTNLTGTSSWVNTVTSAHNPSMACLSLGTCTPTSGGPLEVIDGSSNVVFAAGLMATGVYGFTATGAPCATYVPTGNDACPFQLTLSWAIKCIGSCPSPYQLEIKGVYVYSPATGGKTLLMNSSSFNIDVNLNWGLAPTPTATATAAPSPSSTPACIDCAIMCGGPGFVSNSCMIDSATCPGGISGACFSGATCCSLGFQQCFCQFNIPFGGACGVDASCASKNCIAGTCH